MKRIVICADGTWNVRDQMDDETKKRRPTNVTKLARAIMPRAKDRIDQIVIYHDGVGTGRGLDKLTGGAFGHGIEDNVRELYRSILYNYAPGDEIFLFGFSRGAFTVRTLAGFMRFAGLLEKDDDYFVPDIYACYESGQGPNTEQWMQANRKIKGTRECPEIKMIGVWDTVGALGAPGLLGHIFNRTKYKYHDVGLNRFIQNAYHALAIDEKRTPFAPNLWTVPEGWTGHLEQVWFPGVHCNVGGGYKPDGLANGALHWMVAKAESLDLEFDHAYLAPFQPHSDSYLADSMSLMYKPFGRFDRLVGTTPRANEAIHHSVIDRMTSSGYAPANAVAFARNSSTVIVPATMT